MTIKYVKLNQENSDMISALFSTKPRQIKRLSDDEARSQHWFPVKEDFSELPDPELYHHVIDTWNIVDGFVVVSYTSELIDINERRAVVNDRINALRDERLRGSLTFNGTAFDTSLESYQRITGAVLSAVIDNEFTTDWIAADNTTKTLDANQIIALGKAFAALEGSTVLYARKLKDQLATDDQPEIFDIQQGWPS